MGEYGVMGRKPGLEETIKKLCRELEILYGPFMGDGKACFYVVGYKAGIKKAGINKASYYTEPSYKEYDEFNLGYRDGEGDRRLLENEYV